jgi:hypothetical protein
MRDVPAIPQGILLQVFFRDTGDLWRVGEDGRWLVTRPGGAEEEKQPRSKRDRGASRISTAGLARIRAALDEAGFASLPQVVAGGLPAGAVLPNGRTYRERPIAVTARVADGAHTVEVRGDPAAPSTLGPLAGIYRQLDEEAVGDWMKE